MADDPTGTNFANNGAILITLLSAGALAFSHFAPLQDARPDSREVQFHETATVQTVEARLWQDPFAAVAKDGAKTLLDCSKTDDPHCKPLSVQLNVPAGKNSDVSVIVATVSAAPYPEEGENRRRLRYALVSGLDVMDFVPKDPEHIGYARTPYAISGKPVSTDVRLPDVIPFEWFRGMRNPSQEILVLWLDEDVLAERPLKKFSELVRLIRAGEPLPRMHVIGPSWSDTLRELLIEACNVQEPKTPDEKAFCEPEKLSPDKDRSDLVNTRFYAYGATVNDASLFSEVRGLNGKVVRDFCDQANQAKDECVQKYPTVHDFLESRGVHLLRTIATDDVLAQAVIKELYLRGVEPGLAEWMARKKNPGARPEEDKPPLPGEQHIALISEWDTYYGRTFPQLMQDCAVQGYDREPDERKPDERERAACPYIKKQPRWVHIRTYLHGLDGALPRKEKGEAEKGDATDSSKNAPKESTNSPDGSDKDPAKRQSDSRAPERAFGQGQYDYLRRIAIDLKEEDDELKRNDEGSIRAIGVIGGDVFDKLLVLRALKPQFPDALFFTDDFDALLTLESELRWTRNLLVATSFGPKLREERQKDLPPFRNFAETSAFLTTQLAVSDINSLKGPEPAPKPPQVSSASSRNIKGRTHFAIDINAYRWHELASKPTRKSASKVDRVSSAGSTLEGGRSAATATDGAVERPRDALLEQNKITEWLQKTRMFEVERTGGMLALSEEPPRPSDYDCQDAPVNCQSIQPGDPPLFPTINRPVKLVLGGILAVLWLYAALKMNAYRRALKEKREQSESDKKASKLTFESFACWSLIVLFVTLGVCTSAMFLSWPIFAEQFTNGGDPMLFLQGVSVWPSILLRAFTLGVAVWLISAAWRKLDINLEKISDKLKLVPPNDVIGKARNYLSYKLSDEPTVQDKSEPPCNVEALWNRYIIQQRSVARFWRVIGLVLLSCLVFGALFAIFGIPVTPGRGILARRIYLALLQLDVFAMLFLMFFVVDATLLCYMFVKKLAKRNTLWPQPTKEFFISALGLEESSIAHGPLDDWIDVRFIAKRTSCIAGLIYYPFFIIALMIVCRSSLFGNFPLSEPVIIVQASSIAIVVGCAIMLNHVADEARSIAKKHLSDAMIKAQGSTVEARADQWKALLDRVANMQEGSFRPFLQQPIVGAVLLPLGSLGWTTVLEQGHLFGF
jgi:hypothetical protein